MAKMGTAIAKVIATGPAEYGTGTSEYVIVLNSDGKILRKRSYNGTPYREPYASLTGRRHLTAEVMAPLLADRSAATAKLTEIISRGGYTVTADKMAAKPPADTKQYGSLREKIAAEKAERAERYARFAEAVKAADVAGKAAATACVPVPMHVVQHANPLDDNSPIVKRYAPVAAGVCGFAWVNVRPANSSFAIWATKNAGWRSARYEKAAQLWIHDYGQSMEKKETYARAYAAKLREYDIPASAGSRMG